MISSLVTLKIKGYYIPIKKSCKYIFNNLRNLLAKTSSKPQFGKIQVKF